MTHFLSIHRLSSSLTELIFVMIYYDIMIYIDFCCLYFFIYLFILLVTEKPFLGTCNKICMYVCITAKKPVKTQFAQTDWTKRFFHV